MTSPSAALGGFELALDASPDVLSAMVHFLATSTLLAPSRGHARLELVKLAIELNMPLLTKLAVDAVHSQMTLEMVDEVHNFGIRWGISELIRVSESFAAGRLPTLRFAVSGTGSTGIGDLKDAIFASLQDVSHILDNDPVQIHSHRELG